MPELRSNKKSRYVSYGGDDNKIKMLADALNRNTEDTLHDQVGTNLGSSNYNQDRLQGDLYFNWETATDSTDIDSDNLDDYITDFNEDYIDTVTDQGTTSITFNQDTDIVYDGYIEGSYATYHVWEYGCARIDGEESDSVLGAKFKRIYSYIGNIGKFENECEYKISLDVKVNSTYFLNDRTLMCGLLIYRTNKTTLAYKPCISQETYGEIYSGYFEFEDPHYVVGDSPSNKFAYVYQSFYRTNNDYVHYDLNIIFNDQETNGENVNVAFVMDSLVSFIPEGTTVFYIKNFNIHSKNPLNGRYISSIGQYIDGSWKYLMNPGSDVFFQKGIPYNNYSRDGDVYFEYGSSSSISSISNIDSNNAQHPYYYDETWDPYYINRSKSSYFRTWLYNNDLQVTQNGSSFSFSGYNVYNATVNKTVDYFMYAYGIFAKAYYSPGERPGDNSPHWWTGAGQIFEYHKIIPRNDKSILYFRVGGLKNDNKQYKYTVEFNLSSNKSFSIDNAANRFPTIYSGYTSYDSDNSNDAMEYYDSGIKIQNESIGRSFKDTPYEFEYVTAESYIDFEIDVTSILNSFSLSINENTDAGYEDLQELNTIHPTGAYNTVYLVKDPDREHTSDPDCIPYYWNGSEYTTTPRAQDLLTITISNLKVTYLDSFGKIYYKHDGVWIEYKPSGGGGGGSSDLEAVEIDKDTYEALPTEEKEDPNKIYFVEDYPSGGGGGGGSSYGYVNPTAAGSDGDIYYLLDNFDKKRGTFLYMVNQWKLIDGLPHYTPSEYIPQSDPSKILCEATLDNFDATRLIWGEGNNPVQFSSTVSLYNSEAVLIPTKTDGTLAYVDIGNDGHPFTAYIVAKVQNANGSYTRILSSFPYSSASSGQGIMLYGTIVSVSSWANDSSLGISATNNYFVGVLQFAESGSAAGKCNNSSLVSKPPTTCGRYITIGRTNTNPSINNPEPTDMLVKYMAVVDDIDDSSTIGTNVSNLMTKFGIS